MYIYLSNVDVSRRAEGQSILWALLSEWSGMAGEPGVSGLL
jgi:hypothetical protein